MPSTTRTRPTKTWIEARHRGLFVARVAACLVCRCLRVTVVRYARRTLGGGGAYVFNKTESLAFNQAHGLLNFFRAGHCLGSA